MKRIFKSIILPAFLLVSLTGCLKEYEPTAYATQDQVSKADKASLSRAVAAYMTTYTTDQYYDVGFAGFMIWRDAMSADLPIADAQYDYFSYYNYQNYLGNYILQTTFWQRYYYLVQKANLVLGAVDGVTEADLVYEGNARTYRAMAYLDMSRMYEYRHTGVASLDAEAQSRGIYGLTVPLVTEKTAESAARNNPRVPFYHLYRFILDDLSKAETCLASTHTAETKTSACLGVVYGMKARTWLELGSRFEKHPEDLNTAVQNEDNKDLEDIEKLGVTTAQQCFQRAASYARLAIQEGFTPMGESDWYNTTTGFNTPNSSWMWCITISPNDPAANACTWQSWVSFIVPEATWGISTPQYNGGRCIDAALFDQIPASDWRRKTWIAPADKGRLAAYTETYSSVTSMSYSEWAECKEYLGFKYHPASGDRTTSAVGNAVSIPLMRVEEMYLIEAEATAHASSVGAGVQLLNTFMNAYRYTDGSYKCLAADLDSFTDEVFRQKRIELWGEGLILWDYRRLEKAIVRGYPGTNHPSIYWYNSYPNEVAPWTNIYIPDSERNFNKAVVLNPDPSQVLPLWTE